MATPVVDIGTLIVETPGIQGGQPCLAGTRVRVATLAAYWQQGYSAEDIANRVFPWLEIGPVYAGLAYYFANRESIDARIEADSSIPAAAGDPEANPAHP